MNSECKGGNCELAGYAECWMTPCAKSEGWVMTDWTDRSRPVLDNYRDWCSTAADFTNPATAQLMHDLAAVLRAGLKHSCIGRTADPSEVELRELLADWQRIARDPETGERVFPTGEEQPR